MLRLALASGISVSSELSACAPCSLLTGQGTRLLSDTALLVTRTASCAEGCCRCRCSLRCQESLDQSLRMDFLQSSALLAVLRKHSAASRDTSEQDILAIHYPLVGGSVQSLRCTTSVSSLPSFRRSELLEQRSIGVASTCSS